MEEIRNRGLKAPFNYAFKQKVRGDDGVFDNTTTTVAAAGEQANMAMQLKSRLTAMRMVRQDTDEDSEEESEDSEWSD